jgi:hypothetical protein
MKMTVQEAKLGPMWTAQDQAHHVASVKKGLVELLEDDAAFTALDKVASFTPMAVRVAQTCQSVRLLCVHVVAIRDELIAWCKT